MYQDLQYVQPHSEGLLQLLSASRCTCLHVLLVHPHALNIIFEGKNKMKPKGQFRFLDPFLISDRSFADYVILALGGSNCNQRSAGIYQAMIYTWRQC
jgi:hypothetical protein